MRNPFQFWPYFLWQQSIGIILKAWNNIIGNDIHSKQAKYAQIIKLSRLNICCSADKNLKWNILILTPSRYDKDLLSKRAKQYNEYSSVYKSICFAVRWWVSIYHKNSEIAILHHVENPCGMLDRSNRTSFIYSVYHTQYLIWASWMNASTPLPKLWMIACGY